MGVVWIGAAARCKRQADGLHNVFLGVWNDPFGFVAVFFVQLFKVDPDFSKLNRIHSAADVNAHDVWYHHIAEISGKSYYTALPCGDVYYVFLNDITD